MRRFFESKLYQVLDYLMRLILLNLLVTIFSLLLSFILLNVIESRNLGIELLILTPMFLTLLPSIIAMFDVIIKYEKKEVSTLFNVFFKSFKKYYLKGLIFGFLLLLIGCLLANSFYYFSNNMETSLTNVFGFYASILFIFSLVFVFMHLPFCIIYHHDLLLKHYVRLAVRYSFKYFIDTLAATMIVVFILMAAFIYPWVFALGGFTLPGVLVVKLIYKKYE